MNSRLLQNGKRLSKKGQKQRLAIISIATHVLTTEGLESLVLRQIAAQADMELGNLQYYFPTRDDLLEAIVRGAFEKDVRTISNPRVDHDLKKSFSELLDLWDPAGSGLIYGLVFAATHGAPRFSQLKAEVFGEFFDHLSALIKEKRPSLSESERLTRAKLITALLDGAGAQPQTASKRQIAKFKADVVDLAVRIAMNQVQ